MARRRRRTKLDWKNAVGAFDKARRLHLCKNVDKVILCPVPHCDHDGFLTERGCRKHVYLNHGWYYYFNDRPSEIECFPNDCLNERVPYVPRGRKRTADMPSFDAHVTFAKKFTSWLMSDSGGSKSTQQANQITRRVLKYLKFCFEDADSNWDIPDTLVEYCIACTKMLTDFLRILKENWELGYSGIIGYLHAISDAIEFSVSYGGFKRGRDIVNVMEIFINRTRKALSKKMRIEWNRILDIDYLEKQGCWASYENLQSVVPYHEKRFLTLITQAKEKDNFIAPNDLSFCTHFIVTLLFLSVKATRPMTYQYLTVDMINSIKGENGTIDQTMFKTMQHYGFDSLIFEETHVKALRSYIAYIRPRLNPSCNFVFVTRTGKQLSQLSSILGNMVYEAVGKYVHPTRLRQIIETASATHLSLEQQAAVSEDQKHSSGVAKVYYKKLRSRDIAFKAKVALQSLSNGPPPNTLLAEIPNSMPQKNAVDPNTTEVLACSSEIKVEEDIPVRAKKVSFSKEEDYYLKSGIKKHGWGNWTAILRDRSFKFDPIRKCNTLQRRAMQKKFNVP